MMKIPGMLMVSAGGRNVGKTEFACSLIRKFSSRCNIIGIKVTAIDEVNSGCPRGESGCGVCSSLKGYYYITEETDSRADKDTCRMLAAGADRVFWLKALKTHLAEAITALLGIIGYDAVTICESNSLRRVVEPGLFVMVKGQGEENWKASAKDVAQYADRIVSFDGNEFDIDLNEIELVNRRWVGKMETTAIIIAGGDSTRMGHDKEMLPIDGQPMIKHIYYQLRRHFHQVLISSNNKSKYSFLDVEVIPDRVSGQGPLRGIASALKASANDLNFVIACDIPQVNIVLMKTMLREAHDYDAVVPTTGPSQYEPLFAVYRKSTLPAIEDALSSGNNRIMDALSGCRVKYIDLAGAEWLKNINTMHDYSEFVRKESDDTV